MELFNWYFCCLVFVVIQGVYSKSLPSFIKPCSIKDPKFDKCVTDTAQVFIRSLKEGNKAFGIPRLDPIVVPSADFSPGAGLTMTASNISISNIYTILYHSVKFDLQKKELLLDYEIDSEITGTYLAKGKVLVIPIEGQGPFNITTYGGQYNFKLPFDIIEKNGKKFVNLTENDVFKYKFDNIFLQFDNLFAQDEKLGAHINTFLNENWKEVVDEVGPNIFGFVSTVVKTYIGNILHSIPLNDLIKDL